MRSMGGRLNDCGFILAIICSRVTSLFLNRMTVDVKVVA